MKADNKIIVRQETESDYAEVYQLISEAFVSAEHADGNEQDLVEALRKSEAFIPELSLVAEIDGKLAGHILFTKMKVGVDFALALAPLSVKPEFQRMGVGTALIRTGHPIAGSLGWSWSLVLGSTQYYQRFGYILTEKYGIQAPEGIPANHFMMAKLRSDARPLSGAVAYAKEFGL